MSTFKNGYPSSTMTGGKRHRGRGLAEPRMDFAYFIWVLLGLALALSYQQGDSHSYESKPSLLMGTTHVSAARATALSTNVARAGRPTMVTMAAGSSRTLIELTNREDDNGAEFHVEVTYLDEDDEHGLIVLRRANVVDTGHHQKPTNSAMEGGRAVYKKAVQMLKNPIVFVVLTGNIATMTGILPPGIAGFLPALGFFLRNRMKWTAPILGKLGSFRFGKAVLSRLKVKLGKGISNLYKNRSKYSILSDCLWYVDADGKKSKKVNDKTIDGGSTYNAIS